MVNNIQEIDTLITHSELLHSKIAGGHVNWASPLGKCFGNMINKCKVFVPSDLVNSLKS